VTSVSSTNVMITWTAPEDNGAAINSYTIYIRTVDEVTFEIDSINCDGSLPAIRDARECTIPVSTLQAHPYSFDWGAEIYAKVVATNDYGDSIESELGNGAIIMT
jgi:hypothetical protein